jgi:hypothetical protein
MHRTSDLARSERVRVKQARLSTRGTHDLSDEGETPRLGVCSSAASVWPQHYGACALDSDSAPQPITQEQLPPHLSGSATTHILPL